MKSITVTIPDGHVCCHVEGSGDAVVLLPSFGRCQADFADIAQSLAKEHLVLRPEHRTWAQDRPLTLAELAGDVLACMEAASVERAVVVGHAFGSWTARKLADLHPERVLGVVVAASAASDVADEIRQCAFLAADVSQPRDARLAALRKGFFAPGNTVEGWLDGWSDTISRDQSHIVKGEIMTDWWGAGGVPMLDLQGASDAFRPQGSVYELQKAFPDQVTIARIENAGHVLFDESPELVLLTISSWINQLKSQTNC